MNENRFVFDKFNPWCKKGVSLQVRLRNINSSILPFVEQFIDSLVQPTED